MKSNLLIFSFILMVCACASTGNTLTPAPTTNVQEIVGALPGTAQYTFSVKTWVTYPNLTQGKRIILMGSLLKEGVHLGGIMMRATWPDQIHEQGEPNCIVPVLYGKGVCPIDTSNFSPGVFVPVTVSFEYQDTTFITQTGFTP
ncbi:MAG TPA: hypothetical protein VLD65_05200 [Anaerolineales bacterium]|nr:hypothetical protein [Anaerolineales bacterium]